MTRRIFCKVLLVVVAVFGLLVLSGVLSAQGRSEEAFEHVKEVQERNIDRFMAMDGVEGTAIGYNQNNQLAVKVFTAGPGVRGIPQKLDGVPVQVVVTGKIYALADPTARFPRPVPIGVSTGHPDITAGTIGCRVTDGPNVYALSNNHVYANENLASIGDNVLQPGAYDGGTEGPEPDEIDGDEIGTLFDFEPIVFHPRANNTIDAAIALSSMAELGNATPADDPDGYGIPSSSTAEATLDLLVKKYGRTTGQTNGMITGINATVKVGYSRGTARFVGQIIIESTEGDEFSAGGDSGSLIVTQEGNNPVGLLFAGNSTVTVANQIQPVLDRFGVTVDNTTAGEPPVLTTIEVSPSNVTLYVDETQQFTATGKDQYGGPIDTGTITWAHSNEAVGTISETGLFTAVIAGATTVSATGDGGVSGTADVTVTEVPVLTSIEVSPSSVTLNVGETRGFTATGKDQYEDPIETGTITWASDNTAVGTISGTGLFTATGAGTTTVSASSGDVVGTASVTVEEAPAGDVVTITKAEYRLRNGELNVEATSSEGGPDIFLWVYGYDGESEDYTVDYGRMTYDAKKGKYKLKIKSVVDPQGSVKVVSSLGGSATKTVKYK